MSNTCTRNRRRLLPRVTAACALAAAFLPLAGCGGSSSSSPPASLLGTWGGGTSEAPALLTLTTTGGDLSLACGSDDVLTQPLVPSAEGTFDVIATEHLSLLTPINGAYPQLHLTGTVSGSTITLHEVFATGPGTTYTVAFGKPAPAFNGACPG